MNHQTERPGVSPLAYGTSALLLSGAVMMTLVLIECYPQGPVLTTNPPVRLPPTLFQLATWAATGVFVLGPHLVWGLVAWRSRCPLVDRFALGVAVVYAAVAVPIHLHHCVYINGLRWYYPPSWVRVAAAAAWVSGWTLGLPVLVVTARLARGLRHGGDPAR
jgi:hypothetical protein